MNNYYNNNNVQPQKPQKPQKLHSVPYIESKLKSCGFCGFYGGKQEKGDFSCACCLKKPAYYNNNFGHYDCDACRQEHQAVVAINKKAEART
jgi:hypothetical protein